MQIFTNNCFCRRRRVLSNGPCLTIQFLLLVLQTWVRGTEASASARVYGWQVQSYYPDIIFKPKIEL